MLTLERIDVRYGQAVAVRGVDIVLPQGGWLALVGPNGAGKTSLLRATVGLIPHGGRVVFQGEDVSRLPAWERQARGFGYVPEGRQLFQQMTVEENLRVGGYRRAAPAVTRGMDFAYGIFPRLAERRRQVASTMSGGEQQMLAMARALVAEPRILFVDEVTWGLSPILVAQVFRTLRQLHESGLTIMQVEQNAYEALRHAQDAAVMSAGELIMRGTAAAVSSDPRVVESYIG
jgi:branched-chain amino acid transport system ATP-binding protein